MSKSHRGFLAAGLAALLVGAVGAVSTLHADADEIGATPEVSVAVAPPSAVDPTPPARLPWGKWPRTIRTGPEGASSQALRAAGLAAAPDDAGRSVGLRGDHVPKGRAARGSLLTSQLTDVTPPRPPGSPGASAVDYFYNVGSQAAESDGLYANVVVARPTLATGDYHTLAEVAAQSADGRQIVEVGWTVDRLVNGDDDPHLFVYHWVNGNTTCYNGCGFVQYSPTIEPGDTIAYGNAKRFGIQYAGGAWWVAFDTEWIGYFPESLWTGQGVSSFAQTGQVQAFGEVAAASSAPCTQMGRGLSGNNTSAATISSVSLVNGPAVALYIRSTSSYYVVNALSGRTFRYGGPGAC